jgi:hypothetical protein
VGAVGSFDRFEEVFLIEQNRVALQKGDVFVAKRVPAMVQFLVANVIYHSPKVRMGDPKRRRNPFATKSDNQSSVVH